jgi:hypothetical protein
MLQKQRWEEMRKLKGSKECTGEFFFFFLKNNLKQVKDVLLDQS